MAWRWNLLIRMRRMNEISCVLKTLSNAFISIDHQCLPFSSRLWTSTCSLLTWSWEFSTWATCTTVRPGRGRWGCRACSTLYTLSLSFWVSFAPFKIYFSGGVHDVGDNGPNWTFFLTYVDLMLFFKSSTAQEGAGIHSFSIMIIWICGTKDDKIMKRKTYNLLVYIQFNHIVKVIKQVWEATMS